MALKNDYIKVRVSKEQKELFKKVAEMKGITMTELIVVGTEQRALKEINKNEGTESLELRVVEIDKKLQDLKLKMEKQRINQKVHNKQKGHNKNFSTFLTKIC